MKLSEYSKYRTNKERAEAILHILEGMPGKTLHDDRGQLTAKITKMLPRHLMMGRTSKPMTTSGMIQTLHAMEDAGWIMLETNGKRTYNIFLITLPEDWDEYGPKQAELPAVPEPMVMPKSLPTSVVEKLRPPPVSGEQLREMIREEVRAALGEWWSSLS